MTSTSGPVNLDKGPQPGVSTSIGNTVDIGPLTRESNVKVNESIEVIENIQCDLLKSFYSTKTNGLRPSEVERLAAIRNGLNAFGSYLSVATRLHLVQAILNMVHFCHNDIAVETCGVIVTKIAVRRDF